MEDSLDYIAKNIRVAMAWRNIASQFELSQMTGIDHTSLTFYQESPDKITVAALEKLCVGLNVAPYLLLSHQNNASPVFADWTAEEGNVHPLIDTVAVNVRAIREAHNVSMVDMMSLLNVTRNTYLAYETPGANHRMNLSKLQIIANQFNTTLPEILIRDEERNSLAGLCYLFQRDLPQLHVLIKQLKSSTFKQQYDELYTKWMK